MAVIIANTAMYEAHQGRCLHNYLNYNKKNLLNKLILLNMFISVINNLTHRTSIFIAVTQCLIKC